MDKFWDIRFTFEARGMHYQIPWPETEKFGDAVAVLRNGPPLGTEQIGTSEDAGPLFGQVVYRCA